MDKRIDRREHKTLQALHRALMSLLLRKKYEAITIQEIIDTANVGRSTFYAHFSNKDELWRSGFKQLEAKLRETQSKPDPRNLKGGDLGFSLVMFEHAREYRNVFRALVGRRAGAMAITQIRRVLTEIVQDDAGSKGIVEGIPQELAVRFIVDTFVNVLRWWLDQEPRLSPVKADLLFRRLVQHGIRGRL